MHEAITIITCLGATTEEFCSVATFSDLKHSVVVNLVGQIAKPIQNYTAVFREVTEGVQFTPLGNAAYLAAGPGGGMYLVLCDRAEGFSFVQSNTGIFYFSLQPIEKC
jgi:hypothetical protein